MLPAHVRDAFTEPVLNATAVPGGRKRGNLILSSHFFIVSIISLHAGGSTSLPSCRSVRSRIISFAVVEPRPNFWLRSGKTDVSRRNDLEWILVFGRPSASMRRAVLGIPT